MARPILFLAVMLLLALPSHAEAVAPGPTWSGLTVQQKQVLAPLQGEWSRMGDFRRKKWLSIAERYPKMKPEEQQRVQQNMQEWAKLSPEERRIAREKYLKLRRAPREKHEIVKQKWQEYDQLPEEEKLRLKQAARKRHDKTPAKSRPLPLSPRPAPPAHSAADSPPLPTAP